MKTILEYPLDPAQILRKKKIIRRELLNGHGFLEKRIAVLGGSTTAEVKDILELFLLKDGIKPLFYESEYNRFYEDVMFENTELESFRPDVIYIHTSSVNIANFPNLTDDNSQVKQCLEKEFTKFSLMWDRIEQRYSCIVIQNNFELPHYRILGNMDCADLHGRTGFVNRLNIHFADYARDHSSFYINDINYISSWFGLERWHDRFFWYSYKYAMNFEAIPFIAASVASIIKACFGKTRKCLVLDLDNTIWGGVIGDDGVNGIRIGMESAEAEAYMSFQHYVKAMKERGIILAVCSKNEVQAAKEGFTHPDSVLQLDDISVFKANWNPKHENIREIAQSLNIGLDSLVFIDDNPAEREIVRAQVPEVAVPELGNNPEKYIDILDKSEYFETISLSADDLQRNNFYVGNAKRQEMESLYKQYEDFLISLEMVAEIRAFSPIYLERITQLTNKTNQFNLTTRRYTYSEIQSMSVDEGFVTLYGRLLDKFGDNGLVSVLVGEIQGHDLHIDLWLMSCRVLKRGLEHAMMDCLIEEVRKREVSTIYGYYYKSSKNSMVSGFYGDMGFHLIEAGENNRTQWFYEITGDYENKNKIIEVRR